MGWFSKKEDTRYIQEFDSALSQINAFAKQFRDSHFQSLELFDKNFQKEKSASDLQKERELFESHLDVLQKLKFNCDLLIDESLKIVRNETALTEKDRVELKKMLQPASRPTKISVSKK
ncbi:hypothetical protein KY359_02095 [Candidatus Woesearchaeota archaeon]|nr:hypothetical protein [Candidatus Woesearchaeota archaeon]